MRVSFEGKAQSIREFSNPICYSLQNVGEMALNLAKISTVPKKLRD